MAPRAGYHPGRKEVADLQDQVFYRGHILVDRNKDGQGQEGQSEVALCSYLYANLLSPFGAT